MKFKKISIIQHEDIHSIAQKNNTTVEIIRRLNPHLETSKAWSLDKEYVAAPQEIKIPKITVENFSPKARYRCKQANIISIEEKPYFSSEIKTEYLFSGIDQTHQNIFHVKLEDYVNSILPQELVGAFELIKQVELLRNNVIFTQNDKAKIEEIHNIKTLKKEWDHFLEKEAEHISFLQELKQNNPELITDFIETGNKEFSNAEELSIILEKNLFYHILLKANLADSLENYSVEQYSQVFPNVKLKVNVSKLNVDTNDVTSSYELEGNLEKECLNEKEILRLYNEMYQPLIKYSFTEYNYFYNITYTIENKTGLLLKAQAWIKEEIKNNYEILTEYELKRVKQ